MTSTLIHPQDWIDPVAAVVPKVTRSNRQMIRPPNILPIYKKGERIAYQLYEDWYVDTPWGRIECPLGMICDGASVPQPLWWAYPPDGPWRAGAVAHDVGCARGGKFPTFTITFEQNNQMMKWVMERSGVSRTDVWIIYQGISSPIGRIAFNKSARIGLRVEPLYYEIS